MNLFAVIKKTNVGYSAYVESNHMIMGLGKTLEEVKEDLLKAVDFHFEGKTKPSIIWV